MINCKLFGWCGIAVCHCGSVLENRSGQYSLNVVAPAESNGWQDYDRCRLETFAVRRGIESGQSVRLLRGTGRRFEGSTLEDEQRCTPLARIGMELQGLACSGRSRRER